MNSIHMKAGFITPERKIDIGSEHLLAFCGLACQKYLKEHPEEINNWKEFTKEYSYFHPFFDFLVFYLKWIPVGLMGDSSVFGIIQDDKLFIQKLPENLEEEDLYDTLYYTKVENPNIKKYIVKADNHTLSIRNPKKKIQGDGIVLQDGIVFLQSDVHQFAIATTILNQLTLNCPCLADDFIASKETYKNDYHWYLIDRLGAILFTEKYAIYDTNLMSDIQMQVLKNLPTDTVEQEKAEEEYQNPFPIENTKELLSKIYKTQNK